MVTSEVSPDGQTTVADMDQFQYSVGAKMYRTDSPNFPVAKGSLNLRALRHPVLETFGGTYTSALSACVTPAEPLDKGVYAIVPSTFKPQ